MVFNRSRSTSMYVGFELTFTGFCPAFSPTIHLEYIASRSRRKHKSAVAVVTITFELNGLWLGVHHGSLNVPIEHHPTIRYMVYNGYYKVMFNIPKMGQLPTPVHSLLDFAYAYVV